jgi:hypothetical protein
MLHNKILNKLFVIAQDQNQNDDLSSFRPQAVAKPAGLERAPALTDRNKVAQHLDTDRTRLSFVSHYSSVPAFPRSPHDMQHEPKCFELNRGVVYLDPTRPESENMFLHGADV